MFVEQKKMIILVLVLVVVLVLAGVGYRLLAPQAGLSGHLSSFFHLFCLLFQQ